MSHIENAVHLHNGILFSLKKKETIYAGRWHAKHTKTVDYQGLRVRESNGGVK
jgi:hypothetical protein